MHWPDPAQRARIVEIHDNLYDGAQDRATRDDQRSPVKHEPDAGDRDHGKCPVVQEMQAANHCQPSE
jgi:hypothetical protein